jgi:hypothetical protein
MQRLEHPSLMRAIPWPDTKWTARDKPILIVDGELYPMRALSRTVSGNAAYVVGAGDREVSALGTLVDVEFLRFYELRAARLEPLSQIQRLRHLKIEWDTKLRELDAIAALENLETLIVIDTPKVRDLSPLKALTHLAALEYSGGIWNKQHADSLEPLASLPKLEELVLTNLRVQSGGLTPLARCRSLRTLRLSNQFDTEDYAFLSVALPQVQCDSFHPWVPVELSNGADTMITGRRKPFLNSSTDGARIAAYERAFRALQAKFASEISTLPRRDPGNHAE